MDYSITRDSHHIGVTLSNRFTFEDNPKFKVIMDTLEETGARSMTLDLSGVTYMDSAAVGMLLLLKDIADRRSVGIAIVNAADQVKKILEISNLQQLFAGDRR